MNLAEIIDTVEDTTENSFEFDQHVDFITQAEKAIFQTIKFPVLTKQQTTNTSANTRVYLTETDYLYTRSLMVTVAVGDPSVNKNFTLIQKDHSFIEEAYPGSDADSGTGTPKYYATRGVDSDKKTEIILAPTPSGSFATVHTYAAYPDSITKDATTKADTNTSWLGDNFDNVLLNGAMVEAAKFMKAEADMVGIYNEAFLSSLKMAEQLNSNIDTDESRQ